jgi:hypothetical protein
MFLLDYLDNLPWQKLSADQLKMFIWVMNECGTPKVPTFSALRKVQERLQVEVGFEPKLHTLLLGNHFYMNHPAKLLSLVSGFKDCHSMTCEKLTLWQDWGNPCVRPLMRLYPELDVPVCDCWQAEKWTKESSTEFDSPMWANWDSPMVSWCQFFVHELVQTMNDKYIMIERWVKVAGTMSVNIKCMIRDDKVLT